MDVVTCDARGARLGPDGAAQRAHWELAAKRGSAEALARLHAPPYPEPLRYLHHWFGELAAARGEGMSGPAPLTHQDIAAWASLTHCDPAPHEVRALLALDAAWRAALRDDESATAGHGTTVVDAGAAWPLPNPERG